MEDIFPDSRGSCGREGHEGYPRKLLPQSTEAFVVGPEVVAPLADAVGLIDDKPGQHPTAVKMFHDGDQLWTGANLRNEEKLYQWQCSLKYEEMTPNH